jgi:hypothetical protein
MGKGRTNLVIRLDIKLDLLAGERADPETKISIVTSRGRSKNEMLDRRGIVGGTYLMSMVAICLTLRCKVVLLDEDLVG